MVPKLAPNTQESPISGAFIEILHLILTVAVALLEVALRLLLMLGLDSLSHGTFRLLFWSLHRLPFLQIQNHETFLNTCQKLPSHLSPFPLAQTIVQAHRYRCHRKGLKRISW